MVTALRPALRPAHAKEIHAWLVELRERDAQEAAAAGESYVHLSDAELWFVASFAVEHGIRVPG